MQTKHNEILLSMILNHPDLQPYLHPEAEGRLPVKVITTKEMGVNYLMEKYGMAVSFYSSKPKGSSNAFIQFESFIADDAECAFKISYQAEGIVAQGNIKKINNEWAFSKFSVIEQ